MKKIPNAARFTLAVASHFHSPEWQAAERRRFETYGLRIEKHLEASLELIDSVREALSLSGQEPVWHDAAHQFFHFASTFDTYALHVAAYGGHERHILWAIGTDAAGALGRTWAFWCLDEKILPDLPDGDLWFLPRPDANDPGRLVLPVEVIARWWADQLDGPRENVWADRFTEDGEPLEAHRTFQPWVTGKATPEIKSIMRLFDDAQLFPYKPELLSPPSTQTVRRLMLFARSLERAWKDLVAGLTPGVSPHEPDPMRNKALQLAELFRLAFLHTFEAGTGNTKVADGLFNQAIPEWLQKGPFQSILPNAAGRLPNAKEVAFSLTERLRAMDPQADLPDVFADGRMVSAALARPDGAMAKARLKLRMLLQKGYDAWGSHAPNRAIVVRRVLSQLRGHPYADHVEADIHYLATLDALSRGEFEEAAMHVDNGTCACASGSFGPVELALARLSFGFKVRAAPFNQNETEKDFRVFSRALTPDEAGRWHLWKAPLVHSMRLAAVDVAEDFQRSCRPYPGAELRHPLEESKQMFKELQALLLSDANDGAIRLFRRKYKRALKLKLRDVRGDTVFTLMSKMVPDVVRTMQEMAPFDALDGSGDLPTSAEMAERLRRTYMRIVRQLPLDQLSAQDYLGQTALMLAADKSDDELTELLIERGVETDQQDSLGRTALHSAVRSGAFACFEMLLSNGANPQMKTCEGKTVLVMAAEFGRDRFLERLMSRDAFRPEQGELQEALTLAGRNHAHHKSMHPIYCDEGSELDCLENFSNVLRRLHSACDSKV